MEPLRPEDREALKRAHPGLTDADIDRSEELIELADSLDATGQTDEAARVRLEVSRFVEQRMPRYREVARELAEVRREELRQRRRPPRVIDRRQGPNSRGPR